MISCVKGSGSEVRRPGRAGARDPKRTDHDHAQEHDGDRPRSARSGALPAVIQEGSDQQENAYHRGGEDHDVAFQGGWNQRQHGEIPEQIPVGARISLQDARIRRFVERGRPKDNGEERDGDDQGRADDKISPRPIRARMARRSSSVLRDTPRDKSPDEPACRRPAVRKYRGAKPAGDAAR